MSADTVDARALHRRKVWGKVGRYALLTVLSIIVLFPIYITIVNSLLPPVDITRQPPKLFPTNPQFGSYQNAWNAGHMGTYLKNSAIVTLVITVGQVLTAILAGYAFAFLRFPFKRTLFVVFLATLMVPFEVTIVTNVTTISDLGWYNTYAGLAVPFLATGFGAFLMRQAFLTLPGELRDAAALDGYGHWRFLWRVAVPLAPIDVPVTVCVPETDAVHVAPVHEPSGVSENVVLPVMSPSELSYRSRPSAEYACDVPGAMMAEAGDSAR